MSASDKMRDTESKRVDAIRDQATKWLLRQRSGDMDAGEWDDFSDWLAVDERHSLIFEELATTDAGLDGLAVCLDETRPEEPREPARAAPAANDNPFRRFAPLWGGALAAALFGALLFLRPEDAPEFRQIETAPGEQRVVTLQTGVTMVLNSGTSVDVARNEPTVRFSHGEAAFEIDSVGPSQLRVEAGGLVLTDYGTSFDVILDERSVRVAVADGVVLVDASGRSNQSQNLRLAAGEQLEKQLGSQTLVRSPIASGAVMGWREGRLEFDSALAGQVASDVGRNLGVTVALSDRLASTYLTGVLGLAGDEEQVVSDLAALLGGNARQNDNGWRIE